MQILTDHCWGLSAHILMFEFSLMFLIKYCNCYYLEGQYKSLLCVCEKRDLHNVPGFFTAELYKKKKKDWQKQMDRTDWFLVLERALCKHYVIWSSCYAWNTQEDTKDCNTHTYLFYSPACNGTFKSNVWLKACYACCVKHMLWWHPVGTNLPLNRSHNTPRLHAAFHSVPRHMFNQLKWHA